MIIYVRTKSNLGPPEVFLILEEAMTIRGQVRAWNRRGTSGKQHDRPVLALELGRTTYRINYCELSIAPQDLVTREEMRQRLQAIADLVVLNLKVTQ